MVVLIKTLQVILALSILIIIHESGHFTFARLFGVRVEKFFLFFDIGGKKLFSTRSPSFIKLFPKAASWETEYGIGWLPLGGYCKISGMIDESMDLEQMKQEPKPWELRTKPAWKRLFVMAGGVLYNFIFAILAYILIMDIYGSAYFPNEGNCIYVNELSYSMGFRTGDRILSFDDFVPEDFGTLQADLARRDVRTATVLRGNDTLKIWIDQGRIAEVLNTPYMFELAIPFVVDSVMAGSANAVLRPGDRIFSLEGEDVPYLQDARKFLASHSGETLSGGIIRGADTLSVPLQVDSLGRVGVFTRLPLHVTREYTFLQAIPAGLKLTGETIGGYLRDLRMIFTPRTKAYKAVGSFIAIGQVFPSAWDWYTFINLLALLSIMLGVMNLLPIPGLDGGHIVFCLYEMLTGKKPSDRFMTVAQAIGMFLLLMLMFLAFGNDIGRLIH